MKKRSLELSWSLWNDEDGTRLVVCPDGDGLGLVEIRRVEADQRIAEHITVAPDEVPKLIEMLGYFKDKESPDAAR